jgi:hypothetical protein
VITDRRARLHRALDAAFDISNDLLDKLKAHEFSARKIGSTKEADVFLAKIRQYEPGYTSKEPRLAVKPQGVSSRDPQGIKKTYRQCTMLSVIKPGRSSWQVSYVIVRTPDGQRVEKDDERTAKLWIDRYWED